MRFDSGRIAAANFDIHLLKQQERSSEIRKCCYCCKVAREQVPEVEDLFSSTSSSSSSSSPSSWLLQPTGFANWRPPVSPKRSSSRKRREHFTPTKEIGKYLNRTERSLNPARWEQCKRHFWLFDGLPTRRLHYSFTSMFNFTTNSWPLRHILETIDVSPVNRPLRINAMAVLNSNFESNVE